ASGERRKRTRIRRCRSNRGVVDPRYSADCSRRDRTQPGDIVLYRIRESVGDRRYTCRKLRDSCRSSSRYPCGEGETSQVCCYTAYRRSKGGRDKGLVRKGLRVGRADKSTPGNGKTAISKQ